MDDALLRADPPELAVVDEVAPRLSPVGDKGRECAALNALGDVADGCADDVVAAADGEGLGAMLGTQEAQSLLGVAIPFRGPGTQSPSAGCSTRTSSRRRHSWRRIPSCPATSGNERPASPTQLS